MYKQICIHKWLFFPLNLYQLSIPNLNLPEGYRQVQTLSLYHSSFFFLDLHLFCLTVSAAEVIIPTIQWSQGVR